MIVLSYDTSCFSEKTENSSKISEILTKADIESIENMKSSKNDSIYRNKYILCCIKKAQPRKMLSIKASLLKYDTHSFNKSRNHASLFHDLNTNQYPSVTTNSPTPKNEKKGVGHYLIYCKNKCFCKKKEANSDKKHQKYNAKDKALATRVYTNLIFLKEMEKFDLSNNIFGGVIS